jgi:hypothetical protein
VGSWLQANPACLQTQATNNPSFHDHLEYDEVPDGPHQYDRDLVSQ